MNIRDLEEKIKHLSCDAIQQKPVAIDWAERLGEECDGWQAYSVEECYECGETVTSDCGDFHHNDIDADSDCDGLIYFQEPMINYYYPLPHARLYAEDAAKISGPLVLVQFDDGEWALALSGGGMDLSWEICRAHVELGFLPPTHFTLPDMAGNSWNEETAIVVMAMRKSLEVAYRWLKNNMKDLDRIEGILKSSK